MQPGTYAVFETSEGSFTVRLFDKEVPNTVANFIGLAEGTKEWPRSVDRSNGAPRPTTTAWTFHRVINGFMIQGGDHSEPAPADRATPSRMSFIPASHNRPGILSMANAGPNTNGSQFFITLGPTPHLDNRHSVFGEVVEGLDVVKKIGAVPTGRQDRPVKPVVMNHVTIKRIA